VPSPFLAKRRVMSHSTTHSASDWRSAPERDFLAYRLIGLAELHLDSYFADPAGTGDYQRPSRRTSGRGTVPRALASWKRDGVTLTLARLPDDAERFQVDLLSDQFSAVLRLRYLPEDMELRAARVEQFSGDIRAAIAVATEWLNDESDLPEETMLKVALEELADLPLASAAVTEAAEKEAPSDASASAPPPPTAADTRDVKALVLSAGAVSAYESGSTFARRSGPGARTVARSLTVGVTRKPGASAANTPRIWAREKRSDKAPLSTTPPALSKTGGLALAVRPAS